MDRPHPLGQPVIFSAAAGRAGRAAGAICFAVLLTLPAGPAMAQAVRDVTPPGFTPPPAIADGPFTRLPGAPPPPIAPRWRRFFLPATLDAATFDIGPRRLQVAGVVPPGVDAACPSPASAADWRCGRAALTALRLMLRGRAVECFFATDAEGDPLVVPCRVGRTDIAVWLAGQGWAEPAADAPEPVRAAAAAGRCAGRGVWRGRADPAACVAPAPAPDIAAAAAAPR